MTTSRPLGPDGQGPARAIGVFLLDDHEITRRGIRLLLGPHHDLDVVGEAGSAGEAMAVIGDTEPDVAVLDVQLGDGSGIDVCREIRSRRPEITCLMLTSFADEEIVRASREAGAVDCVLKQIRGTELIDGIRAAAEGRPLHGLHPVVGGRTFGSPDGPGPVVSAPHHGDADGVDALLATLTPQERRILGCLAAGASNRQIGDQLGLAEKTVKNYMSNLLMKLGMRSRTEAAVYAARHGIASSS